MRQLSEMCVSWSPRQRSPASILLHSGSVWPMLTVPTVRLALRPYPLATSAASEGLTGLSTRDSGRSTCEAAFCVSIVRIVGRFNAEAAGSQRRAEPCREGESLS
jgi:hypothetical protein